MSSELIQLATQTAGKIDDLERQRLQLGLESFTILEKLDAELADYAKGVFNSREDASAWLTEEIQSLGWKTPWRCIADGNRDEVQRILGAIEYGLPG